MHSKRLDLRPVFLIIGLLLTILALTMLIPMAITSALGYSDSRVFATSAVITFFVGSVTVLANRIDKFRLSLYQYFVLVTTVWTVLPAFAALPFMLSSLDLNYTNAFFEAMSGLTTTGSTVIVGIDAVTCGILLWRAILQWLGGIGSILTAYLVLPILGIGGMQIFRIEITNAHERLAPRITSLGAGLVAVYVVLTMAWTLVLWGLGMTGFDAVMYAMTTLSTGGFSTSDQSLAVFDDARIEMVIVIGMITGSLPFLLYLQAVRGVPGMLLRDTQVRVFLTTIGIAIVVVFAWLWLVSDRSLLNAARQAIFTTVSLMTGTGYAVTNYWQWGGLPTAILFFLIFVGGCAGSTTCAIKVFRFQILYATAKTQMAKLLQPHRVFIQYYNYRPIPSGISETVLGFFFLYTLTFAVASLSLSLVGLDFMTAFVAAATALSNVGQGTGLTISHCTPFIYLPDSAKWILSATMLMGRLEIFSMLVLFLPDFWRT